MVGMANANMPVRAIRQQISSAIDLFVQISRLNDGSRRITYVTECVGMEGDLVTMQDIFVFEKTGVGANGRVTGGFRPTGVRPRFYEKLAAVGVHLPASLFQTVVEIR
jgi:pilus assembly protein CpaF